MKRLFPILGLTFLVAICSCSIREEVAFKELQYPVFYGVMESPSGEMDTKAYVDEAYYGKWNKNDELSIFYGNTYNKKYYYVGSSGTTSGRFDPVGGSDGLNGGVDIETPFNYAIYPFDDYNACQEADGTLIVPFPKERTISALPEGIGASIMLVAKSETTQLPFKHVAGYYGFKLYGAGVSVSSITMKSNNNEPLSGSANVIYDENGDLEVSFVDRDHEDDPTCTFNYSSAIELGATKEESKMFWITLPPTKLASGITLTVKDANGGEWEKVATNITEIKVNKFTSFDPMEVKIVAPAIHVTSVSLDKTALELFVGDDPVTLTATVSPDNAANKNVTWASSDANVATVADGVVTARAAGTATITVTTIDGEKKATCAVTVKPVVTYALAIFPTTADEPSVIIGDTLPFTLTLITTTNGNPAESDVTSAATWTSSGDAATIAAGVATGVAEGTVTITGSFKPEGAAEPLSVTANLTVTEKPNQAGNPVEIGEGENL